MMRAGLGGTEAADAAELGAKAGIGTGISNWCSSPNDKSYDPGQDREADRCAHDDPAAEIHLRQFQGVADVPYEVPDAGAEVEPLGESPGEQEQKAEERPQEPGSPRVAFRPAGGGQQPPDQHDSADS